MVTVLKTLITGGGWGVGGVVWGGGGEVGRMGGGVE